jgi:hypothetical protein
MTRFDIEEDADSRMQWWGFSPYALEDWDREHGLVKVYDATQISRSTLRRVQKSIERSGCRYR